MEKGDALHGAGSPGAGPDLEIRGPRSSRPLDKWRGRGGCPKKLFPLFGPQFGLKIGGPGPSGPPLDPPLLQLITIETLSNGNQPRRVSSFT